MRVAMTRDKETKMPSLGKFLTDKPCKSRQPESLSSIIGESSVTSVSKKLEDLQDDYEKSPDALGLSTWSDSSRNGESDDEVDSILLFEQSLRSIELELEYEEKDNLNLYANAVPTAPPSRRFGLDRILSRRALSSRALNMLVDDEEEEEKEEEKKSTKGRFDEKSVRKLKSQCNSLNERFHHSDGNLFMESSSAKKRSDRKIRPRRRSEINSTMTSKPKTSEKLDCNQEIEAVLPKALLTKPQDSLPKAPLIKDQDSLPKASLAKSQDHVKPKKSKQRRHSSHEVSSPKSPSQKSPPTKRLSLNDHFKAYKEIVGLGEGEESTGW